MTKKEDIATFNEYLDTDLVSLLQGTQEGKKLFYKFCKKWSEFLDSVDKEGRLVLLKMIMQMCCCCYTENISSIINTENSQSYRDIMYFLLAILLQQKNLDRLKESGKEKDETLLDFISK